MYVGDKNSKQLAAWLHETKSIATLYGAEPLSIAACVQMLARH